MKFLSIMRGEGAFTEVAVLSIFLEIRREAGEKTSDLGVFAHVFATDPNSDLNKSPTFTDFRCQEIS